MAGSGSAAVVNKKEEKSFFQYKYRMSMELITSKQFPAAVVCVEKSMEDGGYLRQKRRTETTLVAESFGIQLQSSSRVLRSLEFLIGLILGVCADGERQAEL